MKKSPFWSDKIIKFLCRNIEVAHKTKVSEERVQWGGRREGRARGSGEGRVSRRSDLETQHTAGPWVIGTTAGLQVHDTSTAALSTQINAEMSVRCWIEDKQAIRSKQKVVFQEINKSSSSKRQMRCGIGYKSIFNDNNQQKQKQSA